MLRNWAKVPTSDRASKGQSSTASATYTVVARIGQHLVRFPAHDWVGDRRRSSGYPWRLGNVRGRRWSEDDLATHKENPCTPGWSPAAPALSAATSYSTPWHAAACGSSTSMR